MAYAICISCGSRKRRAFTKCRYCGYSPVGDNVAMAKSLMLSTQWITGDGEPRVSKDGLRRIQAQMRRGVPPGFEDGELARLVAEKEAWDQMPDMSWLRVILLVLAALSIPGALFAIGCLIRHMR